MNTLLTRLERIVAAVELPAGWRAWVGTLAPVHGLAFVFCAEPPVDDPPAYESVVPSDARAMTDDDVRELVLGLVAKLGGDAPVARVQS